MTAVWLELRAPNKKRSGQGLAVKSIKLLAFLLIASLLVSGLARTAQAQSTITIGDTNVESAGDNGNGNLVLAQSAVLGQSATLTSLSFYVNQASGNLILGLYDATGPSGHPGKLLAVTSSFATVHGWNTANVVTPVALAAGTYWLAYLPSSGNLSFVKQNNSGSCVLKAQTFSSGMPATFATSTTNCTPTTWSFYATLTPSGGGTVVNGACGSSNGGTFTSAPTTNLCSAGTASAVTGTGPWTWSCAGSGGGTTASCSAQLQSSPVPPSITTQPQNQTVTVGTTATFSVVATGSAPLSYQWSKNSTVITGATSSSYTTPATVSGDNGATFTVTVSNSAGSQTSNTATLTVNSPPTITTQPQNQSVALGSPATFSVIATGTSPLSYQWSKNGAAIGGATGSSYTTPATVSTDNGATFTVTVSNVAGSQTSTAATLTINNIPPTITTQPQNQTVTVGSAATFSVVATGSAPLSYQWSENGTAISGATSASYTTPATVSGDNGSTFSVQVSNAAGSQTSNTVTLTVNASITIGDTNVETVGDNGNDNLILAQAATLGQSATLVSLSFYVKQASGSLILGLYDATGPSGHPGNLLAVTNSFVTVNGWNTANVVSQVALPAGNYWLAYLPSSGNLVFVKQNNSGSCVYKAQTFSSGMPATFATTTSGCTPTTWSFYATLLPSAVPVINGACGSSNGATLASAPTTNLCTTGTASAVTGTGPWNWTCVGSGGGTTASCSAQLQSSPVPPSITTQPQNQTVTVGTKATFSVVATGSAPLSYQWSKNGTAIGGATSSSYTTPAAVSGDNGSTFSVQVSNAAGSQTSNAATLTVSSSGSVTVTLSPRRVGLTTSEPQTFTATVTGDPNTAVTWSVDNVAGGSSAVGTISTAGVYTPPSIAGTHTVTATSVADTSSFASATVAVTDLIGITTQRYDAARTGQNLSEYALTASVLGTAGAFGKLFSCTISDGPVNAQPLYMANLSISGGTHNVLLVATQNNTVYALDADSPTCTVYWKANLDPAGSVPTPNGGDQYDGDVNGPYGIFSTPVIDPVGGVLYAVAATFDNNSDPNYRLHALSLATGADLLAPVLISATVSGVVFDPSVHLQRPALLLSGNTVFVSFGSYGDDWTYYGWVMGYDKTSLSQVAAFNTAPHSTEGTGAGIWMSGAGPAADSSGAIYLSSGNGPFNAANTLPPVAPKDNFGDTLLELTGSLTIADFFTPASQPNLDANDLDFGSGGVVVLPDGAGSLAHPNLAISSDKESNLYVVDRASLGRYNSAQNTNVTTVRVNDSGGTASTGIFTTATYWNGNVYIGAEGDTVKAYTLSSILATAYPGPSPTSQSHESYNYPGTNVVVSAPGATATTAVAWTLNTNANGVSNSSSLGPAILRAYDATNLATTLWSSSAKGTDTAGNAVKFGFPTVANGKVYVPGTNQITVYGLLP